MQPIIEIPLNCPRLGPVTVETRDWKGEGTGADERIHYNVVCGCGQQHFGFGFTPESLALSQAR